MKVESKKKKSKKNFVYDLAKKLQLFSLSRCFYVCYYCYYRDYGVVTHLSDMGRPTCSSARILFAG